MSISVLAVSGNYGLGAFLLGFLNLLGCKVKVVASGKEGLEEAASQHTHYDVIISEAHPNSESDHSTAVSAFDILKNIRQKRSKSLFILLCWPGDKDSISERMKAQLGLDRQLDLPATLERDEDKRWLEAFLWGVLRKLILSQKEE